MIHYLRLDRHGKTHHFPVERSKVVGRSEVADIHLRDMRVSRLHCRLTPAGGVLWVEDIGSSNLTLINGEPLRGRRALLAGDVLQIGPYLLVVEFREDWLAREHPWEQAKMELRRLRRRAMARPIMVLVVTGLLAGVVVYRKSRPRKRFDANVVFLLEETRRTEDGRRPPPPPKARLRQYVFDGIFTRETSLRLIQKHGLFPLTMILDQNWAIEKFRDRVSVKVYRNEFLWGGSSSSERSARVSLGYTGTTPTEALKIARELGRLLQKHERAVRQRSARAARRLMSESIKRQAHRVDRMSKELLKWRVVLANGRSTAAERAQATVRVRELRSAVDLARYRLQMENRDYAQAEVLSGREEQSMGLRFHLVNWGKSPRPAFSDMERGVLAGAIVFFIALPMVGMVVGMLDRRLYHPKDIERLGINALGRVKQHPGQSVLSLAERLGQSSRRGWFRRRMRG